MPLRAVVAIHFDAELPVSQFAEVSNIIAQLQNLGAKVGVAVTDATPPPATTVRRRRGNGGDTRPEAATAPADAPTDTPEDEGEDEFGATAPSGLSPDEAREKGISLCRQAYNVAQDEVKALRKQLGVTKFTDVPATQAHDFLRRAEALAQKAGIRL